MRISDWSSDVCSSDLYVSGQDGRVLERRNDTWRIFDFVWMLHIMDYTGRQDFNNPLVIMADSGGQWLALSGVWLLVTSFRLGEFVPKCCRPARRWEERRGGQRGVRTVRSLWMPEH